MLLLLLLLLLLRLLLWLLLLLLLLRCCCGAAAPAAAAWRALVAPQNCQPRPEMLLLLLRLLRVLLLQCWYALEAALSLLVRALAPARLGLPLCWSVSLVSSFWSSPSPCFPVKIFRQ